MTFSEQLDDYGKVVSGLLDSAKKAASGVQRLHKAVAEGNVRDMEKLRLSAQALAAALADRAAACPGFEFDAPAYLSPEGGFLDDLKEAAARAGVRLRVMDDVVFAYPVTVRTEAELRAIRIDKKLAPTIRPETVAQVLKKLQARDPKSKPEQFIKALYDGYEVCRLRKHIDAYVDIPLLAIYDVLTLLPGSSRDYTVLDFSRDVYFLDASDITTTKDGRYMSLTDSTGSRAAGSRVVHFVTRDGLEKRYSTVKFTPQ